MIRSNKSSPSKPKNGEQKTENLENLEKSHKKQVRRRVQTRKPYQENSLNMAEARREIVTALKLHRAARKQAREKQHPGPEYQQFEPESHDHFSSEQEASRLKSSRRNPRIYASNNYSTCNNAYSPGLYSSPYSRPVSSSFAPPPLLFIQENLDFVLPTQTLGLKLNLQDFNNLETSVFYSSANYNSSLLYSSSSPSSTTSCSPAAEVVVEIRSTGDDHHHIGVHGNRAEFMKSMEIGPDQDLRNEDFVNSRFDEVMEFPAPWMNANESCLQHYVRDFCSGDDYFQDPAVLPCMDIEEIEGMDGDWLA